MSAGTDDTVERHGCHELMGLSCLVDDEQGDCCSMPEGLRGFVRRDDRLSTPEQLYTECGEFLGGSAF
eukprot:5343500-Pyramimonas_sp.AAC.1